MSVPAAVDAEQLDEVGAGVQIAADALPDKMALTAKGDHIHAAEGLLAAGVGQHHFHGGHAAHLQRFQNGHAVIGVAARVEDDAIGPACRRLDLIDEIQSAAGRADGIILNPGGYAYYSVAILEALQVCGVPAVEVMLADPSGKEPFRSVDVVSFGCQGHFIGEGISGYLHACAYLVQLLRIDGSGHTHLVM